MSGMERSRQELNTTTSASDGVPIRTPTPSTPDKASLRVSSAKMESRRSSALPSSPSASDRAPHPNGGSEEAPRWFFEKRGRLGGASGETVPNAVAASGLGLEDLLVREAIQNSCDAAVPVAGTGGEREEVRVVFRKRTLREAALDRLVQGLQLDELQRRAWSIDGALSEDYDRWLDDLRELPILFIEDYGTTGLGGRLDRPDEDSDFAKFVYDFGFQGKARAKDTGGGSYGLGKGAHARASLLRCFFIHTVIQPFERQGELPLEGHIGENQWSRFQGVCHFPLHETDGRLWTGRGFFGHALTDRADPLANEAAQSLAERFAFPARKDVDRGTTIAILGCTASPSELQRAVEDWWWPRLFQHTLEVELIDEDVDESLITHPRPLRRAEIVPFIRCFDAASGDFFRNSKELSSPELKPIIHATPDLDQRSSSNTSTVPAGRLAMTQLPPNIRDEDARCARFIDAMALIRGSRMVVAYRRVGSRGLPVAATYVASEALDHTLMLSEPITHHDWHPSSARLSDAGRESVSSLLKRLDRHVRRYQTSLLPSLDNAPERAIALERSLGFLLGGGGSCIDALPSQARASGKASKGQPIHIRFQPNNPIALTDGSFVTDGEILIDWMGTADARKDVRLTLQAASIGNDRLVRMDSIAVTVLGDECSETSITSRTSVLDITLCAGHTQSIPVRIGPHPYGVRLRLFTGGEEIAA